MRILRRPQLILAGFVILALTSGVAQEYYPFQVVFVRPETPTPVVLATGTPEELATLEFLIVEPPKYGVLLGIPPDLVYVPQPGFIGTDWVSFLIRAADGTIYDLGTVQLRVLGPAELSALALRFEGSLTFSGPPFSLDAYSFLFGTYARLEYLDTQALATWGLAGFTGFQTVAKMELEGTWPAPWRLPITSTLNFNPAAPALTSWTVDARTMILGWNISYYFYYSGADPQAGSYFTFAVQGMIDRLSVLSRTKFATLTPTFAEQVLALRGPWLCVDCPINWEMEYVHKKTGFERLSFTLRDIPIPCPGCGPLGTYFDVKVTFTTTEKKVEPTLRLVAGIVACVRPLASLLTPDTGLGISGFDLYGVEIRCDLPNGYKARFATSFDPLKDSAVTGYTQFFEVLQWEGPVVPCCGAPGWWQVSLFFSRESGYLFGLAMADINLYFPLSREVLVHVRVKSGLVDPADPTKSWILTWGWKGLF
ncbi:MAG: hypothetical protein ACK42E_02800 [Candidatus Bipolaricaulaceae bacterium]